MINTTNAAFYILLITVFSHVTNAAMIRWFSEELHSPLRKTGVCLFAKSWITESLQHKGRERNYVQ